MTSGSQPGADERRVVDDLLGALDAQFPGRFGEAEQAQIREQIERNLESRDKLGQVSLTNADEPDFVFHPLRSEG